MTHNTFNVYFPGVGLKSLKNSGGLIKTMCYGIVYNYKIFQIQNVVGFP